MPFDARVFRILVASPSDVEEEREIVSRVIQEWNDLNASERGVVLVPLRWETHSSPELGSRPQAVINRQLVDEADMLVGVFWTRLGSPTGEAQSGTVEEIERAGKAGRLVMLYFSKVKVELDSVDLEQYGKLKEFKQKTYPKGLVETYSSLLEFRDKFSKQIAMKVRSLVEQDSQQVSQLASAQPALEIALAYVDSARALRSGASFTVENIICVNEDQIPNFKKIEGSAKLHNEDRDVVISLGDVRPNREYYRELVRFFRQRQSVHPFRLAISNSGDIGARDVFIELVVTDSNGKALLIKEDEALDRPSAEMYTLAGGSFNLFDSRQLRISKADGGWEMNVDLPVVQARRTVVPKESFRLGAIESTSVEFSATIYSSHAKPFSLESSWRVDVKERHVTYQEILAELGEDISQLEAGTG